MAQIIAQNGTENMNEIIEIGKGGIQVKEWNGVRVVTFKDIDVVHGRPDGTAMRNFNANKKRFIEGEDYFVVSSDEIRRSGLFAITDSDHSRRALITEQGYLLIVKSLNDDTAWNIQKQLIKSYFRVREIANSELSPQTKALMQLVNQIAATELEQKRLRAQVEKLEETADAIKMAVAPVTDNWREEINKRFNRVQKSSGKSFSVLRNEMYDKLDSRAGVDIGTRLRNKRDRMSRDGHAKSKISKLTYMDVIEEDKQLREIFAKIISEYEIEFCA